MKVTVDTNVLVSATFLSGDSDKIIGKVELKEIELVLSQEIIGEFARVLGYKDIQEKIKTKNLEMRWTVHKIVSLSTLVEPAEKLLVVKEDPNDNKVLECAKAGKVDVIVSSDNHLLKLGSFEGMPIKTPSHFLRSLRLS